LNLYLRLLKTLLIGFFQPRAAFLEQVRLHFLVWPNDLDLNLHMNNGRYLTLMDLGRLQLMMRTGLAKHILKNGWMPVLGAASIRYRRPIAPFQRFTLTTRLLSWDEKWFYIEHRFLVKEEVMAVAVVRAVILGKGRSLPTSVFTDLLGVSGPPPEAPPSALFADKL
jgi:acyl-CoA thioesterase FadM